MEKTVSTPPATAGVSYLLDTIKALEKRTSCLLEMSRFVREIHDFHDLLGHLLAKSAELVGADAGVIALADAVSGEFKFVNVHYAALPALEAGKKEKRLGEIRLKLTDGIIGQVHASGEPKIVNDLGAAPDVRKDIAASVEYDVRNLMAVPLRVDEDKLGALEFVNKTPEGPFNAVDLDLASAMASQIALVVEAHRLRESSGAPKESLAALEGKLKETAAERDAAKKELDRLNEKMEKVDSLQRGLDTAQAAAKKAEEANTTLQASEQDLKKSAEEALAKAKKAEEDNTVLKAALENSRGQEKVWKEEKLSLAAVTREETGRRAAAEQALKDARDAAAQAEEKLKNLTHDMETAFRLNEKMQKKADEAERALAEKERSAVKPQAHQAALMRAFSAVSSNQPTEVVLEILLTVIAELLEAEAASLLLTDEDTGRLYFAAATGQRKDPLKKVLLNEGEGIAGWVAKNGRVLNIPDVARDPRFSDQADKSSDFQTRSILAVPLFSESQLIGVAEAVNKKHDGKFSDEDAQTLIAMSMYGAMVIRKSQIYWDMNELFTSTVRSLADAMETRSAAGKGRAERVRRLCLAMAEEMSIPTAQHRDLEIAALLHDVGKVIMPLEILNKPEGLTEDEAHLIIRAPVVAAEILSTAKPLKNVVPMVRHVHERWDGQGHPDKLKEEGIPLGSRVIAVATTYEAMTADRPYRRRLPDEVAVKEVLTLRSAQFDPAAVDALIRLFRKGKLKDLFK